MTIDITRFSKTSSRNQRPLQRRCSRTFPTKGLNDVKQFLVGFKDDLARWSGELAEGQIDKELFSDLLQGQVDPGSFTRSEGDWTWRD